MTITIPSGVWQKYYEAADLFIDNNYIGKSNTLYYPPIRIVCSNCVINHFSGTSTNVYRNGGPAPFNGGSCPLCGGNGYQEIENTGTIRLRIYHSKRDWVKVNNIVIPGEAVVQVIGYSTDLPNLKRANEIRLINEQNVLDQRYQVSP